MCNETNRTRFGLAERGWTVVAQVIISIIALALTACGRTPQQPTPQSEPQPDLAYLQEQATWLKNQKREPGIYYQLQCKAGLPGIAETLPQGGSRIWEIITISTKYPCPPPMDSLVVIRKAQEVEKTHSATRYHVYNFLGKMIDLKMVIRPPVTVSRLILNMPLTGGGTKGKSLIDVDDDGYLDAILEFSGVPFGEPVSDNFLEADLGELRIPVFQEQLFYYCIKREEFESSKKTTLFSDPCCLIR